MQYDQTPAKPKHGIIILDTGAIMRLLQPIDDPKFLTNHKRQEKTSARLMDTLVFLSHHGYEVIVPEMVSYECGKILRDGKPAIGSKQDSGAWEKHTRPFLRNIGDLDGNFRIAPAPASDGSAPARFMDKLWNVHTGHEEENRLTEGAAKLNSHDIAHKSYGDIAAHNLVRHEHLAAVPVFYLSEDIEAMKEMIRIGQHKKIPVSCITPTGLFNALDECQLLPTAGIRNGLDYRDVFAQIEKNLHDAGITGQFLRQSGMAQKLDKAGLLQKDIYDKDHFFGTHIVDSKDPQWLNNDMTFATHLDRLAAELEQDAQKHPKQAHLDVLDHLKKKIHPKKPGQDTGGQRPWYR